MNYKKLEMEFIELEEVDVIRTSSEVNPGEDEEEEIVPGGPGGNQTPQIPLP